MKIARYFHLMNLFKIISQLYGSVWYILLEFESVSATLSLVSRNAPVSFCKYHYFVLIYLFVLCIYILNWSSARTQIEDNNEMVSVCVCGTECADFCWIFWFFNRAEHLKFSNGVRFSFSFFGIHALIHRDTNKCTM